MYPSPKPLAALGFRVNSASGIWLAMNRSEATGSWRRGWDLNPQGPLGPAVFKTARIARFPAPLRANYTRKRRNEDERWFASVLPSAVRCSPRAVSRHRPFVLGRDIPAGSAGPAGPIAPG